MGNIIKRIFWFFSDIIQSSEIKNSCSGEVGPGVPIILRLVRVLTLTRECTTPDGRDESPRESTVETDRVVRT